MVKGVINMDQFSKSKATVTEEELEIYGVEYREGMEVGAEIFGEQQFAERLEKLEALEPRFAKWDTEFLGNFYKPKSLTLKRAYLFSVISVATLRDYEELNVWMKIALKAGWTQRELRHALLYLHMCRGPSFVKKALEVLNQTLEECDLPIEIEPLSKDYWKINWHRIGQENARRVYGHGRYFEMMKLFDKIDRKSWYHYFSDHLYSEVFGPSVLPWPDRLLIPVTVNATLASPLTETFMIGAINVGATKEEIKDVIGIVTYHAGMAIGMQMQSLLMQVNPETEELGFGLSASAAE